MLLGLENYHMITLHWNGVHRDNIIYAVDITIEEQGMEYFNKKREEKKNKTPEIIKWLIPTLISLVSLFISVKTAYL